MDEQFNNELILLNFSNQDKMKDMNKLTDYLIRRKNKLLLLYIVIFLCSFNLNAQTTLYWVGGQGEWNDLSHWATVSGGNIHPLNLPTSLDNVIFDQNSITNGDSIFVYFQPAYCASMTMVSTREAILYATKSVNIYGSLSWEPTMQNNFASGLFFSSTNTGNTINMQGVEVSGTVFFDGLGGSWTLTSALNVFFQIYLNAGTLNTNNFGVKAMHFYSTVNSPRTLNLGNSTFNCYMISPVGGYSWAIEYSNSFTLITGGASNLIFTSGGLQRVKAGDGLSFDYITFYGKGVLFSSSNTYKEVTFGIFKTSFPLNNYTGRIGESPVMSNNNTFGNVTFTDHGTISGSGNNFTSNLNFFGNGSIYIGSNQIDTLNLNRNYPYNGGSTANVLTLQADSTQSINQFNLNGSILCEQTIIKSTNSSSSHLAGIYTPSPLSLEYISLSYIHGKNGADPTGSGIAPDTALNSLSNGSVNWFLPDDYHIPMVDSTRITNVSPCSISSNGKLEVYASGGMTSSVIEYSLTGPVTFDWQDTSVFPNLLKGNYVLKIREKRGGAPTETICFTSAPIAITIDGPMPVGISSITYTTPTCNNICDATITMNATGGIPPYQYCIDWNPYTLTGTFQDSPVFTNLCSGTYNNFMVKDSGLCLYTGSQQSVTIINPVVLTIISATSTNSDCFNQSNGSVQVVAGGGTGTLTYTILPGAQSNSTGYFSNLATGLYTVTVQDQSNCQITTGNLAVNSPDSIIIQSLTQTDLTCNGLNNGSITISASGGISILNYTLIPGSVSNTSGVFTDLPAGNYQISISDQNLCSILSDIITINDPPAISFISEISTNISCYNYNNGTISTTAQGGTGIITYTLQPLNISNPTGQFTNLGPGTYTVTAFDANNCVSISNVFDFQNPAPIEIITSQDSVSCKNGNDGCAFASATGGTPPFNFTWQVNPVVLNDTICSLSAGIYNVQATDANGCSQNGYVQVFQPGALSIEFSTGGFANPSAPPDYLYYAQAVVSGGTPPYQHHWETGELTDMIYGVPEGVYTDTVTDANGCIFIDSVFLQNLGCNIPAFRHVKCYGENSGWALAEGLGGKTPYTYEWRIQGLPDVIGTDSYIENLAPGTYDVTVTDDNTVSSVCTVIITEPPLLEITLSTVPPQCPGQPGIINSNVTGGYPFISPPHIYAYEYLWSNLSTTPSITVNAGNYSLIAIDSLGCISTQSIPLLQPDTLKITSVSSTNITCNNANDGTITVQATGGTGALSYTLNPVNLINATGFFDNLTQGFYTVTITDGSGCDTVTPQIQIMNPEVMTITTVQSTNLTCHDANDGSIAVQVQGGTQPLLFSLLPGNIINSTGLFTNLAPGTYEVSITDISNCPSVITGSVEILNPDTLQILSQSSSDISCHNYNDGSILVQASGGTGILNYTLIPSGISNETGLFSGLSEGVHTIQIEDQSGCGTIAGPFNIINPDTLAVNAITATNPLCFATPGGLISIIASGGTEPVIYSVDNGLVYETSSVFDSLMAGSYYVIVKDSNNCTADHTGNPVILVAPPQLVLTLYSQDPTCAGCTDGQITAAGSGGTLPYFHHWNTGATTQTITGLGAGITYTDTLTDFNGCKIIQSTILSQPSALSAEFDLIHITCPGGSDGRITAHASGGTRPYNYEWYEQGLPTLLGADSILANRVAGSYVLILTDAFGYSRNDTITLLQPEPITVNFTLSANAMCPEASNGWITAAISGGTPGYTLLWSTGTVNPLIPDSVFNLSPGVCSIHVTDARGCTYTAETAIDTLLSPVAIFTANNSCLNTPTLFSDQSTANSAGMLVWNWNFGDGQSLIVNSPGVPDNEHLYLTSGQFVATLIVTNSNGCVSQPHQKTVTIYPNPAAGFSNNTVCKEQTTQFIDQTISVNAPLASWYWDFGDGSSMVQNPGHIFLNHGLQNVKLIVTDNLGCADSVLKTVMVDTLPVPAFTYADSCTGTTIWFNDQSLAYAPAPTIWNWNFGDGYFANVQNPVHSFADPLTNYPVTLTVTNSNGCQSTLVQTVTTGNPINADFSFNQPCIGDATLFQAIANIPQNQISGVSWNFGDGYTGSGITTQHIFGNAGSFTVNMTMTTTTGCIQNKIHIVNILPNPFSIFIFDEPCLGSPTSFTDLSFSAAGLINDWNWDFGDGTGSFQQHPMHTYATSGIKNVTLTVTDNNGCSGQRTQPVNIFPIPTAGFTFISSCQATPTQFADTSNGNGTIINQWLWNFGDPGSNNSSSLQNPEHTYATAGTYFVSLTVTTEKGCSDEINQTVTVFQPPQPDFSVNAVCFGDTTYFTDQSVSANSTILNWLWNFGDGTTSVQQNPGHFYNAGGQYTATLTVTDLNGCIASYSGLVIVNQLPTAMFQFNESCAGQVAYFTDYSNGSGSLVTTWEWNFGDLASGPANLSNLQNPDHIFATTGTYYVTLKVTNANGCVNQVTQAISVIDSPTADFETNTACIGQPTYFNNLSYSTGSVITSWYWDFGDGQSSILQFPSHNYMAAGVFQASLTVTNSNNCISTVTKSVTVYLPPTADFTVSEPNCQGDTTFFINLSSFSGGNGAATYEWSFGDGTSSTLVNPSHLYGAPGEYAVTLVINTPNGCTNSIQRTVHIHTPPSAGFIYNKIDCQSVQFNDASYDPDTTISLWYWNFGDAGSGPSNLSSLQNPLHVFSSPGIFTVQLMVVNDFGCSSVFIQQIEIILPQADFSVSSNTNCTSLPVQFNDQSIANGAPLSSWLWDFGDGTTSLQQNPLHTFTNPGNYFVTLTVTNSIGCQASVIKSVNIGTGPSANFTYSPNSCLGDATQFNDISGTTAGVLIAGRIWDFGDGTFSTLPNPVHTYSMASTYNVSLTVTDANGCESTVVKSVKIFAAPLAHFIYSTNNCSNVTFTDQSSCSDTLVTSWLWNFDDLSSGFQNVSNLQNPQHIYYQAGTYNVTLIAYSATGCSDTTYQTLEIIIPTVEFIASVSCDGNPTQFTDQSTGNGIPIVNWSWQFGDGGISSLQNPTHQYTFSGNYSVVSTVSNNSGCSASKTKIIFVLPKPTASFTFDTPCKSDSTHFTDASYSNGNVPVVSWSWDFGDGNVSAIQNPVHLFANSGIYNVTLFITDQNGCTADTTMQVQVFGKPNAGFTYSVANCDTIFFTSTSGGGGSNISTWLWNFDDAGSGVYNTSTQTNPWHYFTLPGNYDVQLIVTNEFGCKDTVVNPVLYDPFPQPDFTFDTACSGDTTHFMAINTAPNIISFAWNFDDGTTGTGPNPVHVFTEPGTYYVTLIITNTDLCTNYIQKPVKVLATPVAAFTAQDTTCLGNPVAFTNTSTGNTGNILSYIWDLGDGASSVLKNPVHIYTSPGSYNVFLTVTNTNGCSAIAQQTIFINPGPLAGFEADTVCLGSPTLFTDLTIAQGSPLSDWTWNFGDGNSITGIQNPVHVYGTSGSFNVNLTVTDASGCSDTESKNVIVNSLPVVNFTTSVDTICNHDTVHFINLTTGFSVGATYTWYFGEPTSGSADTSHLQNPVHVYDTSGTYYVTLIVADGNSCISQIMKSIVVRPLPVTNFNFNVACANDTTFFTDLSYVPGGSQIVAWAWDFGDGATSSVKNPYHIYSGIVNDTTYSVSLTTTSTFGCSKTKIRQVQVFGPPVAGFTAENVCFGSVTYFDDISTTPAGGFIVSWEWNFGDTTYSGLQNPTHYYTYPGTFNVSLIVTNSNGCSDTIVTPVSVFELPLADFITDTVCFGDTTHFTDLTVVPGGQANTWYWTFGDPLSGLNDTSTLQNPWHVYTSAGLFEATLLVGDTNGCSTTVYMPVKVDSLPIPAFTFTPATCQFTAIHFNDESVATDGPIDSWTWIFGDGTDTTIFAPGNPDIDHIYTTQGTFTATLLVNDLKGCVDSVSHMFIIYPLPVAGFSYSDSACTPGLIFFNDTSYGVNTTINTWLWNFDYPGGYTSNIPDPYHFYTQTDTSYVVMLSVEDLHGCRDTIFDTIFVNKGFSVDFTTSSNCLNQQTLFEPFVVQAANDSIVSATWSFGDGETSTLINASHVYPNAGLFYAQLQAINQFGCETMTIKPVQILQLPEPVFTAEPAGCYDPTYFSDSSTANSTSIVSWHWNFGDGTDTLVLAPSSPDVHHHYAETGNIYTATLTVTNSNGCIDSLTKEVVRYSCLTVAFVPLTTACDDKVLILHDLTATGSPSVQLTGWHWDFGDGNSIDYSTYRDSVTHHYLLPGDYIITLVVTSVSGMVTQTDTAYYTITVYNSPQADYASSPGCTGVPVQFTDQSVIETGSISTWVWDFGDGDTALVQHPVHNFAGTANYTISLTVVSDHGCSDTITKTLETFALPAVHLMIPSDIVCGDSILMHLRDTSGVQQQKYVWNYGDGSTETGLADSISHTFYPGDYEIILTTKSAEECTNSDTVNLTVNALPYAAYSFDPDSAGVLNSEIRFTDLSEGNGSAIKSIRWMFGDGTYTLATNPAHMYADTGHFEVYQIVKDFNGCVDTAMHIVRVFPELTFFMPTAFTPNYDNKNNSFKPVGRYFQGKTFTFQIFSRWGELIYESSDYTEGWNGTYKGLESPVGLYIWVISLRDLFNDKEVYKGTVMLVR